MKTPFFIVSTGNVLACAFFSLSILISACGSSDDSGANNETEVISEDEVNESLTEDSWISGDGISENESGYETDNAQEHEAENTSENESSEIDPEDQIAYSENDTVSGSDEINLSVMSLNIYGHATMPAAAQAYADLIIAKDPDVVGIQEGVHDWMLSTDMPTDYSRANDLGVALGDCWQHHFQIFINVCKGNSFISNRRFDLTDGPNATRTGESAIISKNESQYLMVNIHWDHQSDKARRQNANETVEEINSFLDLPVFLVGDFNTGCNTASEYMANDEIDLIVDGGIDCIFYSDEGEGEGGESFDASPSDHPGVIGYVIL